MDSLGNDALQQVLAHLDFKDLMAAGAACRQLRAATAPDSPLWRRLCQRRWQGQLNTWFPAPPVQRPASSASAPAGLQQAAVDYQTLFLQDNGWASPAAGMAVQQWAGSSWNDEVVAAQPAAAADGSTRVALSSSRELRVLRIDGSPAATLQHERAGVHVGQGHSGQGGRVQWASVAALPGGDGSLVAAGSCYGTLMLWRLPEWHSVAPAQAAAERVASLAFPANNALVGELHYLPHSHRLACLLDPLSLLRPGAQQASQLSVVDAASWTEAEPPMRDVLDGYQLVAAVPAASHGGGGGCEFIAGSVKLSSDQAGGWACRRCFACTPAALCFHKAPASAAALCFFDSRAQSSMVARYATHHRSLYPRLELLREHFLLTSHAGVPVAVWDRRRMNGPVHEVERLPQELDPDVAEWVLLSSPSEHDMPTSQALHLSATPDLLVGRSDSGMCWLFDLSERLGWADGSHPGTWVRQAHQGQAAAGAGGRGGQAGAAAGGETEQGEEDWEMAEGLEAPDEGHLDERDFDCAPLPLGCVGAPFEVWCSDGEEMPPLHYLPRAAAWVSHSHQLLALGGLELEEKQRLFPAHAQGSPYPSNALVLASLHRRHPAASAAHKPLHPVPTARVLCVPTFALCLDRGSSGSLALDVPCSFTAARYQRLIAFLGKEHYTVTPASPASATCLAGCSEHELQTAELLFIRTLGTLRARGAPVPEKTVGKLLGIGVKALHMRCEQLFGCKWAEFLGQHTSSSQSLSSPSASSQPTADEDMELCPAAAPSMTAAEQAAVLPAPAATAAVAAPSAATAATLEPLLASCFLVPDQQCEEEEYDVLGMLLGPCQAPAPAAAPAAPAAAAAPTATTSCGCCATRVCGCEEMESVFFAGQQQQQQQQQQQPAPECGAWFPPTPAAAALPLAPTGSSATVQQLPPMERLSSSLARLVADLGAALQEPPYFDGLPATPAAPAAPAAHAAPGYDALLALDVPDLPLYPFSCPADPLNLASAPMADFPFFFL